MDPLHVQTCEIISADEFERLCEKLLNPRRSKYGRLPFAKLDEPGPEHEWLIQGFLSARDKSIIGGPSGSGKSFLALKVAMALATSRQFFGSRVRRPGLVVYQVGEGRAGFKKRLRGYRQHHGIEPGSPIPFELLQAPIDIYRSDGDTAGLIEEIRWIASDYPTVPLAAVFIDTLATATGGADENSGKDMGAVLKNIDQITRELGCHVCLVHHMNAAGEKLRGHTSITANVDQVILVTKDENRICTARLAKQKDDEDQLKAQFQLMQIVVGKDQDGENVTTCVCVEVGAKQVEKAAQLAGAHELGTNDHLGMEMLTLAINLKGRRPPSHVEAPGWAECVTLTDWREQLAPKLAQEDDDPKRLFARAKQAISRQCTRHLNKKLIGKSGEWIWRTHRKIKGIDVHQKEDQQPQQELSNTVDDDELF